MRLLSTVFLALLSASMASYSVRAQEQSALPKGFAATPVLKSTKTADGDPLKYPSEGTAEIVSVVGTLEPKGQTALHQHPVPVFVYVLEGQLSVQTEGAERREYKQGEAFFGECRQMASSLQ